MSRSKESKTRGYLKKVLLARFVSSEDSGGLRRFQSEQTGLWGYCMNGGTIIHYAAFEKASHFCPNDGVYKVIHRGKLRLFTKHWVEVVPEQLGAGF